MIWLALVGGIIIVFGFVVFFGAPYVPSRRKYIARMFDELRPIDASDTVVDIGSGDGVVLREVSRRGARAVGYELNPLLVWISRRLSAGDKKVSVVLANAWHVTFPEDTTVVYIFSVHRDAEKLINLMTHEAKRLGRPLTLICYANPLPRIQPTRTFEAYHLYIF